MNKINSGLQGATTKSKVLNIYVSDTLDVYSVTHKIYFSWKSMRRRGGA